MVPAFAKLAHRRLRADLKAMAEINEQGAYTTIVEKNSDLGIITSGVSYHHVLDAAPEASVLKLGMTYPLPVETVREFAGKVKRCLIVDEGDPVLFEQLKAAGINVENKPEEFRFGELNVARVRKLIAGDTTPDDPGKPGKPPNRRLL